MNEVDSSDITRRVTYHMTDSLSGIAGYSFDSTNYNHGPAPRRWLDNVFNALSSDGFRLIATPKRNADGCCE